MASLRKQYMDEVNAEYDAWEKKFKEDNGIEEPRDDPVTWEVYNSYYEAYGREKLHEKYETARHTSAVFFACLKTRKITWRE